jgi:AcrR family transcriptional regulator
MTAKTGKLAKLRDEAEKRSGKRADKKRELARNAIRTLGQLGYARTSLRDIAEQSGVSVGIVHYYFEDKIELISYCVQMYKEEFIDELDAAISGSASPDVMIAEFILGLSASIERQASTHTLWYDISAQALFDETFRPVVRQIENALVNVVARALPRMGISGADPLAVYLGCDGIFRHYLFRYVSGDKDALKHMRAAFSEQFARLTAPTEGTGAAARDRKATVSRIDRARLPRR